MKLGLDLLERLKASDIRQAAQVGSPSRLLPRTGTGRLSSALRFKLEAEEFANLKFQLGTSSLHGLCDWNHLTRFFPMKI